MNTREHGASAHSSSGSSTSEKQPTKFCQPAQQMSSDPFCAMMTPENAPGNLPPEGEPPEINTERGLEARELFSLVDRVNALVESKGDRILTEQEHDDFRTQLQRVKKDMDRHRQRTLAEARKSGDSGNVVCEEAQQASTKRPKCTTGSISSKNNTVEQTGRHNVSQSTRISKTSRNVKSGDEEWASLPLRGRQGRLRRSRGSKSKVKDLFKSIDSKRAEDERRRVLKPTARAVCGAEFERERPRRFIGTKATTTQTAANHAVAHDAAATRIPANHEENRGVTAKHQTQAHSNCTLQ